MQSKTSRRWKTRSSAPGEAPAVQTGQLQGSVKWVQSEPLYREIGANTPYAAALEFGTSKMAPRPYLRPALRKVMGKAAERVIAESLKAGLR